METINIYPPTAIFNDPEYCGNGSEQCDFLYGLWARGCRVFKVGLSFNTKIILDNNVEKCPECKEHYQREIDRGPNESWCWNEEYGQWA